MAAHVLAYHDVHSGGSLELNAGTITARRFRSHCAALAERGWHAVALRNALLGTHDDQVVLTVDDGYESVLTTIIPETARYGWTGTAFVTTGALGARSQWDVGSLRAPRHLDLAALRDVVSAGWEIGSHAVTHRALTDISAREAREELRTSREQLSDWLGADVTSISYPFGAVNAEIAALAREAGYTRGVTMRPGPVSPQADPLGVRRWPVYFMDGPVSLIVRLEGPPWARWLERLKSSTVHSFAHGSRVAMRGARRIIQG